MNTSTTAQLQQAAAFFVARYHASRLCAEQAGWNCRVTLQANDAEVALSLHIDDGRVVSISAAAEPCDLRVTASLAILLDILHLQLNPNQPYLFGELTLHGAEADFMRIDYIATLLYD